MHSETELLKFSIEQASFRNNTRSFVIIFIVIFIIEIELSKLLQTPAIPNSLISQHKSHTCHLKQCHYPFILAAYNLGGGVLDPPRIHPGHPKEANSQDPFVPVRGGPAMDPILNVDWRVFNYAAILPSPASYRRINLKVRLFSAIQNGKKEIHDLFD